MIVDVFFFLKKTVPLNCLRTVTSGLKKLNTIRIKIIIIFVFTMTELSKNPTKPNTNGFNYPTKSTIAQVIFVYLINIVGLVLITTIA